MASRILGMGDVVSLVERAAAEVDEQEAKKMQEKMRRNQFDFNDFLSQLKQVSRMGGLESILKFLPGGRQLSDAMSAMDPAQFRRIEAIILSMTPFERENPDEIDFSRRKRIAKGSGVALEQVSGLIKQFNGMRKMLRKNGLLAKLFGGGGADFASPGAPVMPGLAGAMGLAAPKSSRPKRKRKRKNSLN